MVEGSSRGIIASVVSAENSIPFGRIDKFCDHLGDKDLEVEAKCIRIEVEISLGRRIVCSAIGWPFHIFEIRAWNTVLSITLIVSVWWVSP